MHVAGCTRKIFAKEILGRPDRLSSISRNDRVLFVLPRCKRRPLLIARGCLGRQRR